MSNIKTSKKIILITLGILLVLSLLVGVSYAYYIVTHSQTNSNIVKSTCISLSLTNEQNDISLDKQYPISDEAGKALTPYSFTITNTCRNAISYNLNLEMLEGTTLDSKYVKTMLNDNIVNLATLDTTDTSINTSTESRTLTKGALASEESINYEFRMWMDSNTEADSDSMNKEFLAKIVVTGVPTKTYSFDYTGAVQTFTVPQTGTYKIETWGAQGGYTSNVVGGYGGYSSGTIKLVTSSSLYIYVGGMGNAGISGDDETVLVGASGGYNGGGRGGDGRYLSGAGGGGATHVSKVNGLLKELKNNVDDILIVSGGGGGSASWGNPGGGGGFKGSDTSDTRDQNGNLFPYKALGGSADNDIINFGYGADAPNRTEYHSWGAEGKGGGGAGFYGGGTLAEEGVHTDCAGAGASGYIGNTLLTNKVMYCYNCEESSEESTKTISTTCAEETPTSNCAKKGNGYARITYIG